MRPTPIAPSSPFLEDAALPHIRKREPYTVERYPAAAGFVRLVGYDGVGEFMVELVMPARKFTDRTVPRFEQWLRRNDVSDTPSSPSLSLVE